MAYMPMENIFKSHHNRFKVVLLAAKRALELSGGGNPLVAPINSDKSTSLALKEIANGKIYIKGEQQEAKKAEKSKAKKGKS